MGIWEALLASFIFTTPPFRSYLKSVIFVLDTPHACRESSNCGQLHRSREFHPSATSRATPIACDGSRLENAASTLGLWLGRSTYPFPGRRLAGNRPAVSVRCCRSSLAGFLGAPSDGLSEKGMYLTIDLFGCRERFPSPLTTLLGSPNPFCPTYSDRKFLSFSRAAIFLRLTVVLGMPCKAA